MCRTIRRYLYRLQDRLNDVMMHVQSLEKENSELKRERHTLTGDTDAVAMEKRHIQIALETALNEKKRLADRLNQLLIIGELYCKQ